MTGDRRNPFTGWQWAELAVFTVLVYGVSALALFRPFGDRPGLLPLVSLVLIGLMVHIRTWLNRLWREAREARKARGESN
jgi:hypothetical protein